MVFTDICRHTVFVNISSWDRREACCIATKSADVVFSCQSYRLINLFLIVKALLCLTCSPFKRGTDIHQYKILFCQPAKLSTWTQNPVMHPGNLFIWHFCEFRENHKTEQHFKWVIAQYDFYLTSTEGADHWEMIKLFTLWMHFFCSSHTASADIWSNCVPAFLSCFLVICLSDGPKMILQKLSRVSNYSNYPPHTHTLFFFLEVCFIGLHSGVYNKCVFYSEFPIFWGWQFPLWLIVVLFQCCVTEILLPKSSPHFMPPKTLSYGFRNIKYLWHYMT